MTGLEELYIFGNFSSQNVDKLRTQGCVNLVAKNLESKDTGIATRALVLANLLIEGDN